MDGFEGILEVLLTIKEDQSIPKNIRTKVGDTIKCLKIGDGMAFDVQKDKALQELDDISGDPNMPTDIRTQLWTVISALESK